jgi:putative membrane protein
MTGAKQKILVICVDRDNDIGQNTGMEGPIVGKEKALEVATKLSLKDPEESDSNAIFGAVKVFDELGEKYDAEVVLITGHKNRGIDADKEVTKQLEDVLSKRPSDYAVVVTDGMDDEHVIPLIQSRIPILSIKRIVVKQAEQLESGYYAIKDFLKETLDNPKFSRLFFGLPAIVLLLYAALGETGWRIILLVLGVYLFIKGFKLEDYAYSALSEFKDAFTRRRFTFFVYIVALAITFLAVYRGYYSILNFLNIGIFEATAAFLLASIYFFWIAGTIAWLGKTIGSKEKKTSRIVSIPLFGFAATLVIYNVAELVLEPSTSSFNFFLSLVIGVVLSIMGVTIEKMD